jgi:hypothetical protein
MLTVALGWDDRDSSMLAAVDIPIVVRIGHRNQEPLLRYLPGAFVTSATGTAGWLEAIVGAAVH